MLRQFVHALVVLTTAVGSAQGSCKTAVCQIYDTITVVAEGHFQLCSDNSMIGTLALSMPDETVVSVSVRGVGFSTPTPFAIELPPPVDGQVGVDLHDLELAPFGCIVTNCAALCVVTVTHPQGLFGGIFSGQAVNSATWSFAKRLYK